MTLNDFVSDLCLAEAGLRVSSQRVSGYEGGNVTIHCHGASRWCKIRGSCVGRDGGSLERTAVEEELRKDVTSNRTAVEEELRKDGTSNRTAVHDDGDDVLRVMLWQLQKEDSGWYYCSNEDSQMPVHITVMEALDITQFKLL